MEISEADNELLKDEDVQYSIVKRAMENFKNSEETPKTQDEELERYFDE